MKASRYVTEIRKMVKAENNGKVPAHLELTIRNYAYALELRDVYREEVIKDPTKIETGSRDQPITKQNPLCALLYQQETLCLNYAKALGGTNAKAAMKIEPVENIQDNDPMAEYYKKQ